MRTTMADRTVLKALRDFATAELRVKKADLVHVRRVKARISMTRGALPDFTVRTVKGTHYLVCVFRGDAMRVYYFGNNGEGLGASEFIGDAKETAWKEIVRHTNRTFCIR